MQPWAQCLQYQVCTLFSTINLDFNGRLNDILCLNWKYGQQAVWLMTFGRGSCWCGKLGSVNFIGLVYAWLFMPCFHVLGSSCYCSKIHGDGDQWNTNGSYVWSFSGSFWLLVQLVREQYKILLVLCETDTIYAIVLSNCRFLLNLLFLSWLCNLLCNTC